jgi:hypothetical protein
MKPQLIQAAKKKRRATAIPTYTDSVVKAEITATTPEATEDVGAALTQAAQMARDMAA